VLRRPIVRPLARIVLATLAVSMLSAGAAASSLSVGETSQHGVVRVFLGNRQRITGLIIELRTRCTDHTHRNIWPGFVAPFQHHQDATGQLGDSYDIVGRDAATGVRFMQRASFSARRTGKNLSGSASVAQTFIRTAVTCTSPRVTFSAHL
jgi:hypothetical protein